MLASGRKKVLWEEELGLLMFLGLVVKVRESRGLPSRRSHIRTGLYHFPAGSGEQSSGEQEWPGSHGMGIAV